MNDQRPRARSPAHSTRARAAGFPASSGGRLQQMQLGARQRSRCLTRLILLQPTRCTCKIDQTMDQSVCLLTPLFQQLLLLACLDVYSSFSTLYFSVVYVADDKMLSPLWKITTNHPTKLSWVVKKRTSVWSLVNLPIHLSPSEHVEGSLILASWKQKAQKICVSHHSQVSLLL